MASPASRINIFIYLILILQSWSGHDSWLLDNDFPKNDCCSRQKREKSRVYISSRYGEMTGYIISWHFDTSLPRVFVIHCIYTTVYWVGVCYLDTSPDGHTKMSKQLMLEDISRSTGHLFWKLSYIYICVCVCVCVNLYNQVICILPEIFR